MAQPTGTGTDNASARREHWRAATDSTSNYFTSTDVLKSNGGDPATRLVVRIESAINGEIEGNDGGRKSKKRCVMVKFYGHEKKLGLNVTNATALEKLTGTPYYSDWNDMRPVLCLYVEPQTNNGKPGVRIDPNPIAKSVLDLFTAIDNAKSLAEVDAIKPKLREAPAKFKPALKLALDAQVALINAAEGSGAD